MALDPKGHAIERAKERLAANGVNPVPVLADANTVAEMFPTIDVAVRLRRLTRTMGDASADVMTRESNGDEVWAICRKGIVTTVMLRRSTQPSDVAAFGVDKVKRVAGK